MANLTNIIENILDKLVVPVECREAAILEGHIAYHENRDIKQALLYFTEGYNANY